MASPNFARINHHITITVAPNTNNKSTGTKLLCYHDKSF